MTGISCDSDFMYFLGNDAIHSDINSAVFSEERVLPGLQRGGTSRNYAMRFLVAFLNFYRVCAVTPNKIVL